VVDQADEWQEDGLSCRGFDNCGFANTSSIEVDIGSLLGCFGLNIEVKKFDNIADEVR
jgi:hypothetical protein